MANLTNHQLCYTRTKRFSVINESCNQRSLPQILLKDLLQHSKLRATSSIRQQLLSALREEGFCFLLSEKGSAPSQVIQSIKESLRNDIFGDSVNERNLQASPDNIYLNEKGLPMYHLGYEYCSDGMREVYRMAGGRPDDQPWPNETTRAKWLRGLGLCRHITDVALDLLLPGTHRQRPGSRAAAWLPPQHSNTNYYYGRLAERPGDLSMFYAMHYFNQRSLPDHQGVILKPHVDPSMLVLEPFLCQETRGLQVWDRFHQNWMDVDGPYAPVSYEDYDVLLLFVGKALAESLYLTPTVHRVVTGTCPRYTAIYEQKYEEYYPTPSFD